ncbi:MAG: hypothetical protein Q9208_002796 [Pyrenodesmia sp. 3 TL-2023]
MAPGNLAPAWYPLRSVTQRLSATAKADLPHVVPFLATTISSCGAILAETDSQGRKKSDSEAAIVVHKLKTQISTLLQHGSKEARWAAVVLVKATVEAGERNVVQASGNWVRAMLGFLGRPEPATTKKLCLVTLTRIFLLTNDSQSLVRDLTTPSLPSFITACVRLSKDNKGAATARPDVHDSVLSTVLWAFSKLLPQHPRTFKPFLDQIRDLVLPLTAPTPSNLSLDASAAQGRLKTCSEILAHRARHLFVLLNTRALKSSSSQEWEGSFSHIILAAQHTADRVFRGLVEDLDPEIWNSPLKRNLHSSLEGTCHMRDDKSEWPGWTGIHAGLERLNGHLLTIQAYLISPTPVPVAVPVPKLVGLIDRLLSALPPLGKGPKEASTGTQTRPEISRDEREAVWTWLPSIHVSVLQILEQLVVRLGESSMSLHQQLLNLTMWTFEHERAHVDIRRAVYRILPQLSARGKVGLHRPIASILSSCLQVCCDDMLPPRAEPNSVLDNNISMDMTSNKDMANAEAYLRKSDSPSTFSSTLSDLQELASKVLSAALEDLPPGSLSFAIRSKIDRTAVLTQNMRILQSSVLNPPTRRGKKKQSSVMPLLARQYPQSSCTETLLRPRMPLLPLDTTDRSQESDQELDEREENMGGSPSIAPATSGALTERHLEKSLADDRLEAMDMGLKQVDRPQTQGQPSRVEPQMSADHEPKALNLAKRNRESEYASFNGNPSEMPAQLSPPSSEQNHKRMRTDESGMTIPATTEDDAPSPDAYTPSANVFPPAGDMPVSAEPITTSLGRGTEHMNDDDSDDSSIPPIDPTMDTEDEEAEESDID